MAIDSLLELPGGTRAALNTLAAASGLEPRCVYWITGENRLAVALTTSTYQTFSKEAEAGGLGAASLTMPFSGFYIDAAPNSSTISTGAGVANRMESAPFIPSCDVAIDQIGVNCTTGVASANAKVAIYAALSATDHKPGALITESANLDCSTSGLKMASYSYTFLAGKLYWLAVRTSSTQTLSVLPTTGLRSLNRYNNVGINPVNGLRKTLTFGTAAPDPYGTLVTTDWAQGPFYALVMRCA